MTRSLTRDVPVFAIHEFVGNLREPFGYDVGRSNVRYPQSFASEKLVLDQVTRIRIRKSLQSSK